MITTAAENGCLAQRVGRRKESMGKRDREHRERIQTGQELPYRNGRSQEYQMLKCGKCGAIVSPGGITAHLVKCQPDGAKCGICQKIIPSLEFWEHFQGCKEEPVGIILSKPECHAPAAASD